MIRGFKGNNTTTSEEWLIDYSLKTGNVVNVNTDLISMPIKFDGKEVDAFILDIIDNKLVIQLALPLKCKFDDKSNRYEISYVRKLINSNEFLNRFNQEFVKYIQPTKVNTEDYVTIDMLWLLSHEEIINRDFSSFKPNHECHAFEIFKTIDLEAYSRMLLKLNMKNSYDWRLRSAYSYYGSSRQHVGYVNEFGHVGIRDVHYTDYGVVPPACIIC